MSTFAMNDKRVINGWAFFDWANSAFALVITTAIFPVYYLQSTYDIINIGNLEISNSSLYAFAISATYLILACFSPLLSGMADYGGRKKQYLKMFTRIGAIACLMLFFFTGVSDTNTVAQNNFQTILGTGAFMLSMIGFAGGLVFYNAYLPEIVTEDRYDMVSAKGFSYGFLGSVLLLILNLVMIQKPQWFGLPQEGTFVVRLSFIIVGLWWLGFSQIPFRRLPDDPAEGGKGNLFKKGLEELHGVWKEIRTQFNTRRFLSSFFFFNAGVQAMLYLAGTFAEKELSFGATELILLIILLQFVGIIGAYFFAKVSVWKGNKFSIVVMLAIWIAICLAAYFTEAKIGFYYIAAAVGLVMGGMQSLSRATYSKLMPEQTEDTTSYFSFYDVLEKLATVAGTFSFGIVEQWTGDMRISLLAMASFFVVGLLLFLTVSIRRPEPKIAS